MVLLWSKTVDQALAEVRFTHRYEFEISTEPRTLDNTDEIIPRYAAVKQHIVVILNSHFPHWMGRRFRLKHWLQRKKHDELAYFLNEAGSNCLAYADHKIPAQFRLWIGKKGFLIGITQSGGGFPAREVYVQKRRNNLGGGFRFYARCRSKIFFDSPAKATEVYLLWKKPMFFKR
ncbi:TPA: hypothetical protein HA241_06860 [Candidatus Woesearchaeota archaeon]|nr:hypothetical protein [Candidatus Woesearchaeota archaeon]